MSLFKTVITTDLYQLIQALPKGSFIHSISLNLKFDSNTRNEVLAGIKDGTIKPAVEVEWENTCFDTGLYGAVDFPLENVLSPRKSLPSGVRKAGTPKPATLTPPEPQNVPTVILEPAKPIVASPWLNSQQIAKAVENGQNVEFQGIEPFWKPFDPKTDCYIEGYFYRLAKVDEVLATV